MLFGAISFLGLNAHYWFVFIIFWPGRYDAEAVPFLALLVAGILLKLPGNARALFQFALVLSSAGYFVHAVRSSEATGWLSTLDPAPLGDRAAGRYICSMSEPGDFVVYSALSRSALSYYTQRFGCADKLKEVGYPAGFELHGGCFRLLSSTRFPSCAACFSEVRVYAPK